MYCPYLECMRQAVDFASVQISSKREPDIAVRSRHRIIPPNEVQTHLFFFFEWERIFLHLGDVQIFLQYQTSGIFRTETRRVLYS